MYNKYYNQSELKIGVSGIMRVKNDATFIEACVESCIEALDELIIVWNDCTDNSAEEIEKMRMRYPDKIKTYEYKYKVYSVGLTKEEYEYVKSLPTDSPHLLCNYYNFALSKVTYQYAVKIDADQIYISNKLKNICDTYRCPTTKVHINTSERIAYFIIRLFRKLDTMAYNRLFMPDIFKRKLYEKYLAYTYKLIKVKKVCTSLSGINVLYKCEKWYVPMGLVNPKINILPPFNGVNDHLIFRINNETYYKPFDSQLYRNMRSESYSYIETFNCPYKIYNVGFFWFHLNQNRRDVRDKIYAVYASFKDIFIEKNSFFKVSFDKMKKTIPNKLMSKEQKSLFSILFDGERVSKELPTYIDDYVIDSNYFTKKNPN